MKLLTDGNPAERQLAAVLSLQPPPPVDGEVRCSACQNEKLSRLDLQCWRCGSTDYEIISEELRVWMRIPPPPAQKEDVPDCNTAAATQPPQRPSLTYAEREIIELLKEMVHETRKVSGSDRVPGGGRDRGRHQVAAPQGMYPDWSRSIHTGGWGSGGNQIVQPPLRPTQLDELKMLIDKELFHFFNEVVK